MSRRPPRFRGRPAGGRTVRGLALGLVVLATAPLPAGAQPASPDPGGPAGLWRRIEAASHADSAAVLLERFLDRHGRHPLARRARHRLADYHFARGDYARARPLYGSARGDDPEGRRARLGLALTEFALGEWERARRRAREVIESDGDDPGPHWQAHFLIALAWQAEDRHGEALAAFRRLFSRGAGPDQPSALAAAARAAEALGHEAEAREFRRRLLEAYPNSPEATRQRIRARREGENP